MLKKRQVKFQTYEPEKKLDLRPEHLTTGAIHYGNTLGEMWGGFRLFFSAILLAIQGFFKAKEKISDIQMKNAKIIDFRKAKDRPKKKLSFK